MALNNRIFYEKLSWIDIEYINFNRKDAIGNYFVPWITTNELTLGPNSQLTYNCAETNIGPYLSFDSIIWDDCFILDIKAGSFASEMAQKVITKILNNNQHKLKITLYSDLNYDPVYSDYEKEIVTKIFDFFNQIEDTTKIICLEYKLKCEIYQDIFMEGIRDLKTNIFSDIEIWQCKRSEKDHKIHQGYWKVWKWEE